MNQAFIDSGRICNERNGDLGKYVGSAAAARDMVALNDAVEGAGQRINYWGISYVCVFIYFFDWYLPSPPPGHRHRLLLPQ